MSTQASRPCGQSAETDDRDESLDQANGSSVRMPEQAH
jgi:hypothetical protein